MILVPAETPEHFNAARTLFREYERSLDFDLCFQDFERELANLELEYSPPGGALLLTTVEDEMAGCGAVREFSPGISEMKRLYVRPQFRGKGIGRHLAEELVSRARFAGYQAVRLDTAPWMEVAIALYESLGFRDIEPYRPNPIPGARYMELAL